MERERAKAVFSLHADDDDADGGCEAAAVKYDPSADVVQDITGGIYLKLNSSYPLSLSERRRLLGTKTSASSVCVCTMLGPIVQLASSKVWIREPTAWKTRWLDSLSLLFLARVAAAAAFDLAILYREP